MTSRLSGVAANAACDAQVDLVDGGAGAGKIIIYDGTAPTDVDTAITSQNVLSTITMADPAFGAATAGVATALSVPLTDSSADASGTATFYRVVDSDDTAIIQGDITTVAVGTGELQLVTTTITATQPVTVTGLTHTQPES